MAHTKYNSQRRHTRTRPPQHHRSGRILDPSPALSEVAFYPGDRFADRQNDLFPGAPAPPTILRIELSDNSEGYTRRS